MSSFTLRRPWKRASPSTSLNAIMNCIFGLSSCSMVWSHDVWPLMRIITPGGVCDVVAFSTMWTVAG
jgi:hypothetical protein